MTRELPILYSPQMVRCLPPRGPKSQTRRTRGLGEINESPDDWTVESADAEAATMLNRVTGELRTIRCPYGPAGTRLWVREAWAASVHGSYEAIKGPLTGFYDPKSRWSFAVQYAADRCEMSWKADEEYSGAWRPSIHMPRWASRFTFINTGWRIERVQEITEADAKAEGIERIVEFGAYETFKNYGPGPAHVFARDSFRSLWDSINGKKLPWSRNPWCWVISFEPQRMVTP